MALIAIVVLSFVFNAFHGHAVAADPLHNPVSLSIVDADLPAPEKAVGGECFACVAGQFLVFDNSSDVAVGASRILWMPTDSPSLRSRKLGSRFRPPIA